MMHVLITSDFGPARNASHGDVWSCCRDDGAAAATGGELTVVQHAQAAPPEGEGKGGRRYLKRCRHGRQNRIGEAVHAQPSLHPAMDHEIRLARADRLSLVVSYHISRYL